MESWEEACNELATSAPLDTEAYKEWLKMYPDSKPRDIHDQLVRRKKYAFRMAYDCMQVRDNLEEDSPLRQVMQEYELAALVELRQADVALFSLHLDHGEVRMKKDQDLFFLVGMLHGVNDWVYDKMWRMNEEEARGKPRSKKLALGTRTELVGNRPGFGLSTKELMKQFMKSMRFLTYFCENVVADLMNLRDMEIEKQWWVCFVKRVGILIRIINSGFEPCD